MGYKVEIPHFIISVVSLKPRDKNYPGMNENGVEDVKRPIGSKGKYEHNLQGAARRACLI